MDNQYASGVSDYSSSKPPRERQNSPHAGKSNRAVLSSNLGRGPGKPDGKQEDGSSVSDYSPRECNPATSKYFASGEEGLYSPTSPRYSRPGSRHAVSDYSDGDEDYDSTSDPALRRARRSKRLHGLLETDTTAACGDMQPANKRTGKLMASLKAFGLRPDQGSRRSIREWP